jgi:hypothetical protein
LEIKCWNRLAKLSWRPFDEARDFVKSLNLKSQSEWNLYINGKLLKTKGIIPFDIPLNPRGTYNGKGWISMGDWLGTGTIAPNLKVYRNFEDALRFVRSLELKDGDEWRAYCAGETSHTPSLPNDIPKNPDQTYYSSGWMGMGVWIGNGYVVPSQRKYKSFIP